jgi:hypothetical protein
MLTGTRRGLDLLVTVTLLLFSVSILPGQREDDLLFGY